MSKVQCSITKQWLNENETRRGDYLRKDIFDLIQRDYPDFNEESYISIVTLNRYRKKYLEHLIASESQEMDDLEREVLDALTNNKILSENIEMEIEKELSIGEKLADLIAGFGGSWSFISLFFLFILLWMAVNIWIWSVHPFDPYPFILLNLILSCLAAIQAPIILMSQNRAEDKDRKRGEHDFQVNLKAELEIKLLTEKVDHIIANQNKKIFEIGKIQIDYLEDILEHFGHKFNPP